MVILVLGKARSLRAPSLGCRGAEIPGWFVVSPKTSALDMMHVSPESVQPCNMKNRDIYWRYKTQETLYIGQWCLSPLQSRCLGTSHSSPNLHQLPPLSFPESHRWSEFFSLSKVILVLGKARSHTVPNLGCRGPESSGWFDVLPKTLHETYCMSGCIVVMKLPITKCP